MKSRGLVLLMLASLTQIGASRPLNPLVVRLADASRAASQECAEGVSDAPAAPRLEVAQIPMPAATTPPPAPPTGDLRDALRATHDALAHNDRATFDASLARVREIVRTYPAGGQRREAERLVQVWDDIARVWDAQFESPFFGSESVAYKAASAYPGYAAAIGDDVLIDDRGRKFYPAEESRKFLARIAEGRLGGRTTAARPRRTPSKVRSDDEQEDPKKALPTVVARRSSTPTRRATPPPARNSQPPSRETPPASALDIPPAAPIVATQTVATNTIATSTIATNTVATDTVPTDTVATAAPVAVATDTTTTTTATADPIPASPQGPKRNLIVPLIVILVGVGMLILLFRTKS